MRTELENAEGCRPEACTSPTSHTSPGLDDEHKSLCGKDLGSGRQVAKDEGVRCEDEGEKELHEQAMEMLADPGFPEQIVRDVHRLGVVGEDDLILMTYATGTARLRERAINLCVHGHQSSGKSFTVGKVLDLLPREEVKRATQVTRKHLLNLSEEEADRYRHRVIFTGEMVSGEGDLAFREMSESGEVRSLTVQDGKSRESVARGPITFITTTTLLPRQFKDEDASRWFYFSTDESSEQTTQVMSERAESAKSPPITVESEDIVRKHHAAQKMLAENSDVHIIIPFADLIKLPPEDPTSRRLHDRILRLVEAVTFLTRFREGRHRDDTGEPQVFADEEDWRIALPLIEPILAQKYGRVMGATAEFMKKVESLGGGPFNLEELARVFEASVSTIRRRIDLLPVDWCKRDWVDGRHLYTFKRVEGVLSSPGVPSYDEVSEYLHGWRAGEQP